MLASMLLMLYSWYDDPAGSSTPRALLRRGSGAEHGQKGAAQTTSVTRGGTGHGGEAERAVGPSERARTSLLLERELVAAVSEQDALVAAANDPVIARDDSNQLARHSNATAHRQQAA
jgi:hypothetical protein